jgi:hypothetical protein
MQARIEQGALKLRAETPEDRAAMKEFFRSLGPEDGYGIAADVAISNDSDDPFFMMIRPAR